MPDTRLPDSLPRTANQDRYRIMRKGSRYNILGPHGRIFTKYQSASQAGPRWEELTHTPWPYDSTAYERGHRLWELGLIERTQIGQRLASHRTGQHARQLDHFQAGQWLHQPSFSSRIAANSSYAMLEYFCPSIKKLGVPLIPSRSAFS